MAGNQRHWREKGGRFYARIAVPEALRPFLEGGKAELIEALGGDRREALRKHPSAVARLQAQLEDARTRSVGGATTKTEKPLPVVRTSDIADAVWQRYDDVL